MSSIHSILKEYWGYQSFRPSQEKIINAVLAGKDTLALLPTGGGKSLCFQIPALYQEGLCLVISPLIALMKDQVENLRKKNITAFAIYSGMQRKDVLNTLTLASNSNCKFLYVSPERLETHLFKEWLPSLHINLIAVDEAHCISQWGYDFRPSYLKIAALREELPGIPILALTASATPEVQNDICEKLEFREKNIFRQSFSRPNLSYSVFNVPSKTNKIIDILNKVKGTAIIYCKSRKRTKEISDLLVMQNISADYYHAGLNTEQRNQKQEAWLKNKINVIVCTNAFGMGIDKPDVRLVIHADIPDCLENYYQEAGRAGRDGQKSYAVLLYDDQELEALREQANIRFPNMDTIRKIYGDLMNHLQIPSGYGAGNNYDIDTALFIRQFQLDPFIVFSVFKTLEQEDILFFNDQVFTPSKIQVNANRPLLTQIENEKPELDMILKFLLRNYEGIIDHAVNIYESNIANSLRMDIKELTDKLKIMDHHSIITYQPQPDKPQIFLFYNRVPASDLQINLMNYEKRKQRFTERIQEIISYATNRDTCRSVIIGKYFDDNEITSCGICDVCLEQKRKPINQNEFDSIHNEIISRIKASPVLPEEIMAGMPAVSKIKILEIIRLLQQEEKITLTKNGQLKIKASAF